MSYKDPEKEKAYQESWREKHREELRAYHAEYRRLHKAEAHAYWQTWYAAHREEHKEATRKDRLTHPEWKASYDKGYYLTHRDEIAAQQLAYREEHREELRATARIYYENHKVDIIAKVRAWALAHPEERMNQQHKRRARKRGVGHIPYKISDIAARDKGRCGICHTTLARNERTIDHILPLSRGGVDAEHNVQLAHRRCNSAKNNTARYPQNLRLALTSE